jgi:hypothetical protein
LKEVSAHSYVAPYNIAVIYAGLGDKNQAFQWLDRAYADRSGFLVVHFKPDAHMDSLRSDPPFGELVRRMLTRIGRSLARGASLGEDPPYKRNRTSGQTSDLGLES